MPEQPKIIIFEKESKNIKIKSYFSETVEQLNESMDLDLKDREISQQKILENLLLPENMEKFSQVFQTERGSWYFVSKEGCIRFKAQSKGDRIYFTPEPVMKNIFYISSETAEKILRARENRVNYLLKNPISIIECGEGTFPLELGMLSRDNEFELVVNGDMLEIKSLDGRPFDQLDIFVPSLPHHIGHRIVKILK